MAAVELDFDIPEPIGGVKRWLTETLRPLTGVPFREKPGFDLVLREPKIAKLDEPDAETTRTEIAVTAVRIRTVPVPADWCPEYLIERFETEEFDLGRVIVFRLCALHDATYVWAGCAERPATVWAVFAHFPSSAYYALSSMSERSLAYSNEPLAHRILILYEAAGMASDLATYLMRSLLSEGKIRYETVEKTSQGLQPWLIEREGPTGLILTTTGANLHPENETRMLSLTVRDDPLQTAGVLRSLAHRASGAGPELPDLAQWHALQTWLELAGCREVTIPYADRVDFQVARSERCRQREGIHEELDLLVRPLKLSLLQSFALFML
jgi:hypothetical protein